MPSPSFICPICQSPLTIGDKTWHCTADNAQHRHHSFDVAKQGYINLLPVQQKNAKNPGDSEQAILARQRFLSAGYYQVLITALADFAQSFVTLGSQCHWLDVGCGEGYYTEQFLQLKPTSLIALDISKPAVMATAKRLKSLTISPCYPIVASASHIPVMGGALQVISTVFSPILPHEFARVLSPGGQVIIAKPASHHLVEMRQGLFEQVIEHDSEKFIDEMAGHFRLSQQQRITEQINVTVEALADLLAMTPYAYRAKLEKSQSLMASCQSLGKMTLTLDFVIYGFEKIAKSD